MLQHLIVVHKTKQVLYRYYVNNGDHKANTFVMYSIWVYTVNTVNADVTMKEEILVFHFQITTLDTAILLYSNLQNQKIYTEVSAAPNLLASSHSGLFSSDGSQNAKW
jgi:hypothetical protein